MYPVYWLSAMAFKKKYSYQPKFTYWCPPGVFSDQGSRIDCRYLIESRSCMLTFYALLNHLTEGFWFLELNGRVKWKGGILLQQRHNTCLLLNKDPHASLMQMTPVCIVVWASKFISQLFCLYRICGVFACLIEFRACPNASYEALISTHVDL